MITHACPNVYTFQFHTPKSYQGNENGMALTSMTNSSRCGYIRGGIVHTGKIDNRANVTKEESDR